MMETTSGFGALLRTYRTKAGLSQEELAERARLSIQAISALERGVRRAPYRATVALLSEALGLNPQERAHFEASATNRRGARSAERASATLGRVPFALTALVGRDRELDQISKQLERDDVRLLTIIGPGGVGKTHVALAIAQALHERFSDGVAFVALAAITETRLVLPAIASALRVRDDGAPIADALAQWLGTRRMLLVLDNLEQVIESAADVLSLLAAAPHITILATSRELLRVRGEHHVALATLEPNAALELFLQRANVESGAASESALQPAVAARICDALEGLPLAIELAAARLRFDSPATLLAHVDRRLETLVGGARDLPRRQQSMRETIAWSFELLDPFQQRFFAQLAVFSGSFSAASARAIAQGDLGAGSDVAQSLRALVEKSLLQRAGEGDGEPRVAMLATIREYARERLDEMPDSKRIYLAHARYYAELADTAERALVGLDQGGWVARLDMEFENIRGALAYLRDVGEAELGLQLCGALWRYWTRRGYLAEGREWLADFLNLGSAATPPTRARALLGAAMLAQRAGVLAGVEPMLEESLELARFCGDTHLAFFVLNSLGMLAKAERQYERARALLEESLQLRKAAGAPRDIVVGLNNLGAFLLETGDLDGAAQVLEESVHIEGGTSDPWAYSMSLQNLGELAHIRGEFSGAVELLQNALALRLETRDGLRVVQTLNTLGDTLRDAGRLDEAFANYMRALRTYPRFGNPGATATKIERLVELNRERGETGDGARFAAEAAALRAQ